MRLTDLLWLFAAALIVCLWSSRSRSQEDKLSAATALYEEARTDGLLWRSRYEERADRLRAIERDGKRIRALISAGRALPLPLEKKGAKR